jgi:hypothetical protein
MMGNNNIFVGQIVINVLNKKAFSEYPWADGLILSPVLDRIMRYQCHRSLAVRQSSAASPNRCGARRMILVK